MADNQTDVLARVTALESELQKANEQTRLLFVNVCSILVFLMQAGFCYLEIGGVRSKNVTSMMLKNLLDTMATSIVYFITGYAFAFGPSGNSFIGLGYFLLLGQNVNLTDVFFQFVFCNATVTIVSGAMAERSALVSYFFYSILMAGFVYPVVSHWVWSPDGWLAQLGYLDLAGSSVVHVVGGVAAFASIVFLGPRIGRFQSSDEAQVANDATTASLMLPHEPPEQEASQRMQGAPKPILGMTGHSIPLNALGVWLLWVAFLPFNAGAAASNPVWYQNYSMANIVGLIMINVATCSAAAGFTAMVLIHVVQKRWRVSGCVNGVLAGCVSICGGCAHLNPWTALVTGVFAGGLYYGVSALLERIQMDDPVDAVAVHAGGGAAGILAYSLFANFDGVKGAFYGGTRLLWVQPVGLLAIIAWTMGIHLIYFYILYRLRLLRVPRSIELQGYDLQMGGEPAYPKMYAQGDFLKFREFLLTSQFMREFQRCKREFEMERETRGLDRSKYQVAETNINMQSLPVHVRRNRSDGWSHSSSNPSDQAAMQAPQQPASPPMAATSTTLSTIRDYRV